MGPLKVGESVGVKTLKFSGNNPLMARAAGDNFVTDLGLDASPRELEGIGVFGDKQQYAIQLSQESALRSRVRPQMSRPNIFTIPRGSTISGPSVIARVRFDHSWTTE